MPVITSTEDLLVWPCGSWCYRGDLEEMSHLSDDYVVLSFCSDEWHLFVVDNC